VFQRRMVLEEEEDNLVKVVAGILEREKGQINKVLYICVHFARVSLCLRLSNCQPVSLCHYLSRKNAKKRTQKKRLVFTRLFQTTSNDLYLR
jgi:hypothetical protein